jgi:hypothetical protein
MATPLETAVEEPTRPEFVEIGIRISISSKRDFSRPDAAQRTNEQLQGPEMKTIQSESGRNRSGLA